MSRTLLLEKKTIRYAYGSEKGFYRFMHLYVLEYILVSQPNIQHEEMLFNVIRHKQFSTYKMELYHIVFYQNIEDK